MANHFRDVPTEFIKKAVYLGLDPSLRRTGLAFETEDGQVMSCVLPPPKEAEKGVLRLQYLYSALEQILLTAPLRMCAIEGYSFGSKFTREQMGEVGGVYRLALGFRKVPTCVASPSAVKKFLTNSGGSGKLDMIRMVKSVYGITVEDDNEADAVVLSQIARQADLRQVREFHRVEVLDSLTFIIPKSGSTPRIRTRTIPKS